MGEGRKRRSTRGEGRKRTSRMGGGKKRTVRISKMLTCSFF
jgi:hypothetical protein